MRLALMFKAELVLSDLEFGLERKIAVCFAFYIFAVELQGAQRAA